MNLNQFHSNIFAGTLINYNLFSQPLQFLSNDNDFEKKPFYKFKSRFNHSFLQGY